MRRSQFSGLGHCSATQDVPVVCDRGVPCRFTEGTIQDVSRYKPGEFSVPVSFRFIQNVPGWLILGFTGQFHSGCPKGFPAQYTAGDIATQIRHWISFSGWCQVSYNILVGVGVNVVFTIVWMSGDIAFVSRQRLEDFVFGLSRALLSSFSIYSTQDIFRSPTLPYLEKQTKEDPAWTSIPPKYLWPWS